MKLQRMTVCVLGAILLLSGPLGVAAGDPDDPRAELILLNWSEYMDPGILADFQHASGVRVKEVYFENDGQRDELIQETGGRGFDLAVVNGAMLETYVRNGWIAPLEPALIPNLRYLNPRWTTAFAEAEAHAVPLFWGTLGIVYRSDLVKTPIQSWMDILRPSEELRGKIVMMNDARDLFTAALKALGYSANSADPEELAAAGSLLEAQKPFVKAYYVVALSEQSSLVTGDTVAAMTYNGDALVLAEHHEALRYLVPREGSELWVDYLVILAESERKPLAHRFLDFLNEPRRAAQLAEFLHYPSPNLAAEKLLPEEHRNDPLIYPPPEILRKLEPYRPLPPRAVKDRNEVFSRVVQ